MKDLEFSYNWNNKLDCKAFTTLRLSNRFYVGDEIIVKLKSVVKGRAKVIGKRYFGIDEINDYIGYLDTGYSGEETKDILKKMYPEADWRDKRVYFYLIKYEEG